ncbi:MAG: hypothetical protein GY899_12110 [Verrucomicrobiaceae bacterium]|nr:hypothetical protein [Verrucomicrobiaceae bacterium]
MTSEIRALCQQLPSRRIEKFRTDPDRYGASWEVARILGLKAPPVSWLMWGHGVYWEPVNHPAWLAFTNSKGYRILVHGRDQEDLLREHGFSDVHVVGAPILYVDQTIPVERIANSLLVMPPHSLEGLDPGWDENSYVSKICSLRECYDHILVCVTTHCVRNGLWVNSFDRAGIPWIEGARGDDAHALRRMAFLFKSFETVTGSTRGSQIPYAAYFGCKVSLWGPWTALGKNESVLNAPLYRRFPELIEHVRMTHEHNYNLEAFPFLFKHPSEAVNLQDWGAKLLGAKFRKAPEDLRHIFGWHIHQRVWNTMTKGPIKLCRYTLDRIQHNNYR